MICTAALLHTSSALGFLILSPGIVPSGSAEPRYCFPELLFNAGRKPGQQFRLGLLRDDSTCCCCPGAADGIGFDAFGGNLHSGSIEYQQTGTFFPAKVYALVPTPSPTAAPTAKFGLTLS